MHSLKQFLLSAIVLFAANACLAQQCPEDLKAILNDDDTTALAKVVTSSNINAYCDDFYPLISLAIRSDAKECFEWLLEKGADVNLRYEQTKPPLYLVCKYGDLKMFKKLVDKGADLKAHYGDGLLNYAIKYNNTEIVEYLKGLKK